MKKLVNDILNKIKNESVQFADVRFTSTDDEIFVFERGDLKQYGASYDNNSLGVRVLINGAWGFAGTNDFSAFAIENMIKKAIFNAKEGGKFKRNPVKFKEIKPTVKSYRYTPVKDPFLMTKSEKMDYLENIAKKLAPRDKMIYSMFLTFFNRQYKIYANTEGTFTD